MLELNKIYNMDCLEGIKEIPQPDLVIADPPYEFEGMGGGIHRVGNGGEVKYQNIIDIGTNHFDFDKYIPQILNLQKDKVNAYFFCNKTLVPNYLDEAKKRGLNFDILAIRKINPVPAKCSCYLPEVEYIIFLRSKGAYFNGTLNVKYYTKIYDKVVTANKYHPNQKPIGLIRKFIKISSKEGDLILDPFIGSGTTAVASKQLNRNYIGFEINDKYVGISNERLSQKQLLGTLT